MPPQLGKIEQAIMDRLEHADAADELVGLPLGEIIEGIAYRHRRDVDAALAASVRRAAAALERKGLVERLRLGREVALLAKGKARSRRGTGVAIDERWRLVRLLKRLDDRSTSGRAFAALLVERERKRLGLTWAEILRLPKPSDLH